MEFYRQSSEYTGAAAALLMALHDTSPEEWPLDREHEFMIWMDSANLPTRSSSVYALARIAKREGFTVSVVVGEREYDYPDYRFKRYKKVEIEDAKLSSKLHEQRARKAGVTINEEEFSVQQVREALTKARYILLRVNAGIFRDEKATSRYVLVTGYDEHGYHVIDPDQGEMHVDDETMQEAFTTLETKKKRDHRMILLR